MQDLSSKLLCKGQTWHMLEAAAAAFNESSFKPKAVALVMTGAKPETKFKPDFDVAFVEEQRPLH